MTQLLKVLITLFFCIFLFACSSKVSQNNFEKIKTNMIMKEVIVILGEPTSSESVNIAGVSGTSAVWKDSDAEIAIQFLNDRVAVKAFSKFNEDKNPDQH
jgi:hypothetical protein